MPGAACTRWTKQRLKCAASQTHAPCAAHPASPRWLLLTQSMRIRWQEEPQRWTRTVRGAQTLTQKSAWLTCLHPKPARAGAAARPRARGVPRRQRRRRRTTPGSPAPGWVQTGPRRATGSLRTTAPMMTWRWTPTKGRPRMTRSTSKSKKATSRTRTHHSSVMASGVPPSPLGTYPPREPPCSAYWRARAPQGAEAVRMTRMTTPWRMMTRTTPQRATLLPLRARDTLMTTWTMRMMKRCCRISSGWRP
mmetsp:Transcript_15337/g.46323  ORF Transcript_15337/g.46323 Transcript_15337/m.46323 type:complete len:250 (+) Transcript_15337:927-1676(+)